MWQKAGGPPYGPEHPHTLASLSKSFTSTAIGLAVAEGKLSLDDTVVSFFPDKLPENPSENLNAMRIRQLLTMSTGHRDDASDPTFGAADGDWVKAFLNTPVEFKPGSRFVYNTAATFMLSAIIQEVTGEKLVDFLTPRLFEPLGIDKPEWDESPLGINTGGFGLHLKTEDIARFGQMLLQRGEWRGQQIVPAAWVDEATARQVSNGCYPDSDWDQGYGYQFWRNTAGGYRADGAFGQFCIVLPDYDLVVAITSGTPDMGGVMKTTWNVLLPGVKRGMLPNSPDAVQKLQEKLASLELPVQEGMPGSSSVGRLDGKTFEFEANDIGVKAVTFKFDDTALTVNAIYGDGEESMNCTYGTWNKEVWRSGNRASTKYAASFAWVDEDTLSIKTYMYETAQVATSVIDVEKEGIILNHSLNVNFGPTEFPPAVGKLAK